MSYQLIAFDMDGTLLNDQKKVSEETIAAIKKAVNNKRIVVFCSGRCLPELEEFFNLLPEVRYAICVSGAMVYDAHTKTIIYENTIESSVVKQMLEATKDDDIMKHILTTQSIVEKDKVNHMADYGMGVYQPMYQAVTTQVDDINTYFDNHFVNTHKVNFYHRDSESRERTREKFKSLPIELADAEGASLECSAQGVTKFKGLTSLCNHLNIPIEQTIAVGDANNDLDVLKNAGFSIAMGNANDQVKEVCDVIVADNNHNGCVDAIEKYLLKD